MTMAHVQHISTCMTCMISLFIFLPLKTVSVCELLYYQLALAYLQSTKMTGSQQQNKNVYAINDDDGDDDALD